MNCKDCKFCKNYGRAQTNCKNRGFGRKEYLCEHPIVRTIENEHGYPINNFIGYGDNTMESPLQLKTSKKWCPLKKEV